MFAKLLLLVVISTAYAATKECECNTESDKIAVWSYLKTLSEQVDDTKDKNAYSVLPAVLSPLVGCDCQEKVRPKRKIITPNVPDYKSKHIRHEKKYGKKSIHYNDRHCPTHYARVGSRCVKEELLD